MQAARVLVVHTRYQQPGGEDQSFAAEVELLRARGHDVRTYLRDNQELAEMAPPRLAVTTLWNQAAYREIRQVVREAGAQVVVFQNTFPLISPAGYYAARAEGAGVVQVLRNYRLLCPAATLFREGRSCELCVPLRVKWPAVRFGCYRGDRRASAVIALMLMMHHWGGTWSSAVDVYVALTHFARERYLAGGLPRDRMWVRANFLSRDPGPGTGNGGFAIFVGRLSPEKGVRELLAAWALAPELLPLKIVGDGPLRDEVADGARQLANVEWLGHRHQDEVLQLVGAARFLVFPSVWYEGMPRTIIESFARGTPVVAFDLGSAGEMIDDRRTGLRVRPVEAPALAEAARWMAARPGEVDAMRGRARAVFHSRYTADVAYASMSRLLALAAAGRRASIERTARPTSK